MVIWPRVPTPEPINRTFWAFTLSVFPCCYLDCSHDSDHLLPAFLTLPALWYHLCLPPAPTIALPLLMILPCLCFTCSRYWTLPVWPPLVYINKAAFGSQRHWPLSLHRVPLTKTLVFLAFGSLHTVIQPLHPIYPVIQSLHHCIQLCGKQRLMILTRFYTSW